MKFKLLICLFPILLLSSCVEESGSVDLWYYVNRSTHVVELRIYQTIPFVKELRVEVIQISDSISHSIPVTSDFSIFEESESDSVSIVFDNESYLGFPCSADFCENRSILDPGNFESDGKSNFYYITDEDYENAIQIPD